MSRVRPLIFGNSGIEVTGMTYPCPEVKGMSYRLVYVPTESDSGSQRGAGIRLMMLSGSFLLILGLLTGKYWPEGREVMYRLYEAVKDPASVEMLENLADRLQSGVSVREAVTAFCREVVFLGIGQ